MQACVHGHVDGVMHTPCYQCRVVSLEAELSRRLTDKQQHPDEEAVDRLAAAMKLKLAISREKGRGGWDDPGQCTTEDLSIMLRVHVGKGDPVDVANFCMMLFCRGSSILRTVPPSSSPAAVAAIKAMVDEQLAADRRREMLRAEKDRRGPGQDDRRGRREDGV